MRRRQGERERSRGRRGDWRERGRKRCKYMIANFSKNKKLYDKINSYDDIYTVMKL